MATRFGALPLNDSPRTLVFRAIDDILRSDAVLKTVVKTWQSWRGEDNDKKDFGTGQAPAVRITPVSASESYWYPGATKGDLYVLVETLVKGLAVDDVENLTYAITRAVIPHLPDQASIQALMAKLTAAGAVTGMITFVEPPKPDGLRPDNGTNQFRAIGQFKIEVRTS